MRRDNISNSELTWHVIRFSALSVELIARNGPLSARSENAGREREFCLRDGISTPVEERMEERPSRFIGVCVCVCVEQG